MKENKSVFDFSSYKAFMGHRLTGPGRRGQMTHAANALNCQRSYLSRVISEKLHLTPDHAFNLSRFWRLNSEEQKYFQALVEHDRATDLNYKNHLRATLAELKRKHESIQERTGRTSMPIDGLQLNYFSSWVWSAIHFLTSVPEFQRIENLADRLGLRRETIEQYLYELEKQGFVDRVNGKWRYKAGEFHAPKHSPLVILHHQNWRQRAVIDAQNFENSSVHFTGVHTVSKSDFERIKGLILNFIAEATQIAGPSSPEEGIAIACDVFQI